MFTVIWLIFATCAGAGIEFWVNHPSPEPITWIGPVVGFAVGLLIRLGDIEGVGDVIGGLGD